MYVQMSLCMCVRCVFVCERSHSSSSFLLARLSLSSRSRRRLSCVSLCVRVLLSACVSFCACALPFYVRLCRRALACRCVHVCCRFMRVYVVARVLSLCGYVMSFYARVCRHSCACGLCFVGISREERISR